MLLFIIENVLTFFSLNTAFATKRMREIIGRKFVEWNDAQDWRITRVRQMRHFPEGVKRAKIR